MKIPKKPVLPMLIATGILIFIILLMQPFTILKFGEKIGVLFPKGLIAYEQRNLLFIVQALMLLVIIPVYVLTFMFSWIYRADNPRGIYDPDLVDSVPAEIIWWGLPFVMVVIVSVLTWVKTHELDPYKSIESKNKEMTVQVVALQWKWLFIYPEEKIASLNYLQLPVNTPVRFEISADAPMNSFWIPSLGGQIYAMPGMTTILNLIANEPGNYRGSSANISGEGFARMYFNTKVTSKEDFDSWVATTQGTVNKLEITAFDNLALPSVVDPQIFTLEDPELFDRIVNKYMHH